MNAQPNETTTVTRYQMVLSYKDSGKRFTAWNFDTEEEAIEYCRAEIERRNSDEFRANLALSGIEEDRMAVNVEEITTTTTIATKRIF